MPVHQGGKRHLPGGIVAGDEPLEQLPVGESGDRALLEERPDQSDDRPGSRAAMPVGSRPVTCVCRDSPLDSTQISLVLSQTGSKTARPFPRRRALPHAWRPATASQIAFPCLCVAGDCLMTLDAGLREMEPSNRGLASVANNVVTRETIVADSKEQFMASRALIAGVTGIVGNNLAEHLRSKGWEVYGVARHPRAVLPGVQAIAADLLEPKSLRADLSGVDPTHVFIAAWLRQPTEAENCAVNGAMVRNLLSAFDTSKSLRHVALVTGLKHYLGPFEAYAKAKPETPFREEMPRLPFENFYYTQEDELFDAARRRGIYVERSPTAHDHRLRPRQRDEHGRDACGLCHDLPGDRPALRVSRLRAAVGGAHRRHGRPSSRAASGVGRHLRGGPKSGFQHRQRRHFPLEVAVAEARRRLWNRGCGLPRAAQRRSSNNWRTLGPVWAGIAAKHGLAERDLGKLSSAWHTDLDLGREIEAVTDMTKSRVAGFCEYQPTPRSFLDLFNRLRKEKIIPA